MMKVLKWNLLQLIARNLHGGKVVNALDLQVSYAGFESQVSVTLVLFIFRVAFWYMCKPALLCTGPA